MTHAVTTVSLHDSLCPRHLCIYSHASGLLMLLVLAAGILLSLWLLCSLVKANQLMRKVVTQKRDYQVTEVAAALLYIATNVGVVAWLTSGQRLYRSFLLKPPVPPFTVRCSDVPQHHRIRQPTTWAYCSCCSCCTMALGTDSRSPHYCQPSWHCCNSRSPV